MDWLMELSYIGETNRLSLMFNLAAVFIVIGIIWQTGIYRERGRLEDKLFFMMEIMVLAMAIVDMSSSLMNGQDNPYIGTANFVINHGFFILFALICGTLALFFIQRAVGGLEDNKRKCLNVMIPVFAQIVLILSNILTRSFFYIDPVTYAYTRGHLYWVLYVVPFIYVLIGVIMISRINPVSVWLFLLLVAVRLVLGFLHNGVSSTPVCFAIGLAYIQIHISLRSFYEEEKK